MNIKPSYTPLSQRRRVLAATLLAAMLASTSAIADTLTWTGVTTEVWGTGTNWSTSTAPTSADDLTILGPSNAAGALTININAAAAANSINFTNTAATTLSNTTSGANQTLTLGSGGLTTGTGAVTIGSSTANQNINIALSANQAWSVGSGNMTVNNVVSGTGIALTKNGAGTLSLLGANTFNGGITVNAGIADIQNNAALGTGTVTLAGGTLQASGAADRTITNNIVAQTGTTSTLTTSGRNLTINGNISGSGAINRATPTTATGVILGGDNSGYTGTFTQASGSANAVVRFTNANAGSAGASWVFQNTTAGRTTLDFAGTGTISFGSLTGGGHIQANVSGNKTISAGALGLNDTFSGIIANNLATLALTKVGTGTLTLSGANTYTGATTVNAGTLALGAANRIADTSAMVLAGGTFATGGFSETLGTLTLSSNSTIDFGSGTSALVFSDSSAISWSGTLTLTNFDIGTDSLRFGTSVSALTVAQLSEISLAGYTASLDSSGFVTFSAIPEPSTYAVIVGIATLGGVVTSRRYRAKRAQA
jgi:autotransporter-associated beta strand protein